jgi:hypothetical protein
MKKYIININLLGETMLTLSELQMLKKGLADKETNFGSPAMMALAIATKKNRRLEKGLPFNCFIADRTAPVDEFIKLLKLLEREKSKPNPPDMRFQLVCCMPGQGLPNEEKQTYQNPQALFNHWLAMDIVMEKGKLKFFLLDAANSLPHILSNTLAIFQFCPGAQICSELGNLQRDSDNCATFTFDHVCRLAKIDSFHDTITTIFAKRSTEFIGLTKKIINNGLPHFDAFSPRLFTKKDLKELQRYMDEQPSQFIMLPLSSFPKEFGPLIRNLQSISVLRDNFFKKELDGNDKVTLKSYVLKREKDGQNVGIELKKTKIKSKTFEFVNLLSEEIANKIIDLQRDYSQLIAKAKKAQLQGMFTIRHWQHTPPVELADNTSSAPKK